MANHGRAPYSPARRGGDLVFVSGQLGRDEDGTYAAGIAAQTQQAMLNLERIIQHEGGNLSDVVKVVIFLRDIADWGVVTDEYLRWFGEPLPARSAIGVELPPEALVEIEAVAWLPVTGPAAGDD